MQIVQGKNQMYLWQSKSIKKYYKYKWLQEHVKQSIVEKQMFNT